MSVDTNMPVIKPDKGITFPHKKSLLWFWIAIITGSILLSTFGKSVFPWAFKYPKTWQFPLARHLSDGMKWLLEEVQFFGLGVTEITRSVSAVLEVPLTFATSLLSSGLMQGQGSDAVQLLPPLSWLAVIALVTLLGLYAKDWKLALLAGLCFLYLAVFGQWHSAMITLSSIIICVPFGVAGGLFIGLGAHRWPLFKKLIMPILDLMQTIPVFAYLVPVLFLFGFGPVAALVATIIYALPPMVRMTILALEHVSEDLQELGRMLGCTPRQMTWKIMLPSAKAGLMLGVNQVIMLSLNMVIIASMIGAGGLGFDVLAALRRLDIGGGIEAGFAIVVLAIALDRLSQAFANKRERLHQNNTSKSLLKRFPYTLSALFVVLLTFVIGLWSGVLQHYPQAWEVSSGNFWSELVKTINIRYFDQLESVKTAVLLNILIPFKRFLIALPWPVVVLWVAAAAYHLSGMRLALLLSGLCLFIVLMGLWVKAMITVYLCGIAVLFACLLGIPIGIIAANQDRLWRFVQVIIDTLQTLPSFVYLMPIVMLFRVGDFTAMIAVIAYAIAPAIRYTAHGIRQVDPQLIEAGIVAGCTPWQLLSKIRLKLAIPQIMLGINQTIMLALSMLVITALVGTRDLGQEVYIALTKADVGRGIVAGLCVAAIAIIADRLINAGAERLRIKLGLKGDRNATQ